MQVRASVHQGTGPLLWSLEPLMSTVCQQKSREPNRRGRVVALDDFRMHRLALLIADELRAGDGSTWRSTIEVDDVATWRRAARRAGRLRGASIRTGISADGSRVWAVEER